MILIDLPMPEACDVCPFNYDFCWCKAFGDDYEKWEKYRDDWNENVCDRETRPEYCPLKEVARCKDCKYFEIKDWWGEFNGVPVLAASDCPTCNKWADGCMTNPDGFCYLAE